MFGAEWGYGGYGQFHMVVWIILAIAVAAGVVWRLRSGSGLDLGCGKVRNDLARIEPRPRIPNSVSIPAHNA